MRYQIFLSLFQPSVHVIVLVLVVDGVDDPADVVPGAVRHLHRLTPGGKAGGHQPSLAVLRSEAKTNFEVAQR